MNEHIKIALIGLFLMFVMYAILTVVAMWLIREHRVLDFPVAVVYGMLLIPTGRLSFAVATDVVRD